MSQYTIETYTALLNRTYVPRFPRDNRPRAQVDTTDKGETILIFILPHPEDGRFSLSLTATEYRGYVKDCSLRFGQAEMATGLEPEEALAAVEEVLDDNIVAVIRYKDRDAYESHRKADTYPMEWLYQLPDDQDALNRMRERLARPVTLWEKFRGQYTGVFELYRWSGSETVER